MLRTEAEIWRPFTQMQMALPPFEVVSAFDATLKIKGGREIVDAISSWWVITHGHCQPEIVKAVQNQVQQVDQVLFANFTHRPAENLVGELSKLLPPQLSKYFFSDNGSTAVEAALKMTIQYWQQIGEPQKKVFLSFENSYHGDTVGAMSVGGDSAFTKPYKNMLFKVVRLKQGQLSSDSVDRYVSHLEEVLEKHAEQVAGIILEPMVQGAGGMIVWPKEALEKINCLCRTKGALLIFDEVMTGFGRTGALFAFENLSYIPDILCLSKGLTGGVLPLSLTIATQKIYEAFLSTEKSKMFFHGHSFTGNPISCAAAAANLRLISSKDCKADWRRIEKINSERLLALGEKATIRDKRHCGTIGVVELQAERSGYSSERLSEFTKFAFERGVFLRPLGNVIYVLPPYSITNEQLHKTWDVIEEAIESLH